MDKKNTRVNSGSPAASKAGANASANQEGPPSVKSPTNATAKSVSIPPKGSARQSTSKVAPAANQKQVAPAMAPMAGQKGAAQKSSLPRQLTQKQPAKIDTKNRGDQQNKSLSPRSPMRPFNGKSNLAPSSSDDYSLKHLQKGDTKFQKVADDGSHGNWRDRQDRMALYNLQRRLTSRNSSTGKKKTTKASEKVSITTSVTLNAALYVKEMQKKTDLILSVAEQSRLEQNLNYEDRWPLLNLRKEIKQIRIYINLIAKQIIDHKSFEATSISVILLNSLTLAAEDPTALETDPVMKLIEDIFLVLYTIEMVLKILGLGFIFNKGAYLRDSWNILDFVIVGSAYITIFNDALKTPEELTASQSEGLSLNSLRAFRVLRPLRAITSIKGLRVLVLSVLSAMPLLKETMIVLIFFFLIFAIAATQLLSGLLKQRCVSIETGVRHVDDIICGGRSKCPEGYFCGKQNENPNYGVTNFDNILFSLLAVFQCITLEGWSDIQKMYQMAYSDLCFILFLPIVFLGAFFLLNLTLAVINSSFGRTHKHYQELEAQAKERAKRNRMKKRKDADVQLEGDEGPQEIGVTEYFIAKRAARKMIDFLRLKQAQRAEEKLQAQVLGDDDYLLTPEQDDVTKRLSSQAPLDSIPKGTRNNTTPGEDVNNKVITIQTEPIEEASILSEEAHSEQVKKFLQEIQDEINLRPADKKNGEKSNHLAMAMLDLKRAQPRNMNRGTAVPRNGTHGKVTNIKTGAENKQGLELQQNQKKHNYSGILTDESRIDDLLDIDKVLGLAQHSKSPPSSGSGEHPFDLSFIQSNKSEGYPDFSDSGAEGTGLNNGVKKEQKSLDDLEGNNSVIESDISLQTKIDCLRSEKRQADIKHLESQKLTPPELQPAKKAILDDIKRRFKRMQTDQIIDKKKGENMNDTKSTFTGINSDRKGGAVDEKTNLGFGGKKQAEKQLIDEMSKTNPVSITSGKTALTYQQQRRKNFEDVIKELDDTFVNMEGPKDPYEYIDKKTQKIEITTGIPYKSTSQEDVFELRNKLADAQAMSQLNPYVKMGDDVGDACQHFDSEVMTHNYIRPYYEPYQLKTRYNVKHEEQVDFDSDDEDALILALQPFDTVMSVGYQHLLTHIPTKFRARRSDIIVSSTLSITLSPSDGDYKCKDLALMTADQLASWCQKRHEFRAQDVYTAFFREDPNAPNLLDQKSSGIRSPSQSMIQGQSDVDRSMPFSPKTSQTGFVGPGVMGTGQGAALIRGKTSSMGSDIKFGGSMGLRIKVIPPNLLNKPLPAEKISMMTEDEKRLYNIQKAKHDASMRQIRKMPIHPSERRYDLAEARKLLAGKLHDMEDEEDQYEMERQTKQNSNTMYMSRDEHFTQVQFELFESALQRIVARPRFDPMKIQGDQIPKELREELDLPDDLEGNEINYDEIRRKDCNVKRKTPMWSGQDVLEIGMNQDQAVWVTQQLNVIRVWPKGLFGFLKRCRVSLKKVVRHPLFDNFMTVCVLLNTIVMAMERNAMPVSEQKLLNEINSVFTWIFIVELSSKLTAIGIKKYLDDRMNWLDGSVVMISIVEIVIMSQTGQEGGGLSAFRTVRVFRTFRVLRVARLLRSLHSMQVIIAVIQRSAGSFLYITMLLFVFIFIFTLLGMQIFGGRFNFPDGKPRGNYDTFNIALVTVFQVLTMENWQTVLFDSMRSEEIGLFFPAIFYIVWIFVGNFILLNLFLAILLDSFLTEDDEEDEDVLEAERQARILRQQKIEREKQRRMKKLGASMFKSGTYHNWKESQKTQRASTAAFLIKKKPEEVVVEDIDDLEEHAIREIFMDEGIIKKKDKERERQLLYAGVESENSLYLFSKPNKFRLFLYRVQKHKLFDNTIMVLIGFSSFKLALDTYFNKWPEDDPVVIMSTYFDIFLNLAFLLEALTKIVALGFLMDGGSYLRDSWNQLDFFIVFTSMLDMALTGVDLPIIKILRLLRTLRPLRVISHNVAMKLIVASLFESVGAIFNVVIVVLMVWLMFAIFAINIFAGKFFYCTTGIYQNHTKYECNVSGGSWVRHDSNFDDVFQAMMTLFIVASLEGWPDIMLAAVDSVDVDKGPEPEYSPLNAYFFLIFILIGSFFLLNFFIGVLFLKYAQAQRNETKGYTTAHLTWIDIQMMIVNAQCPHDISNMPESPLRKKLWKVVNSTQFDLFIMATIMLNIVQMALSYQGEPLWYTQMLNGFNYIFTIIFLVEAILKVTAYGWAYFGTTWNKFDFFVVCASLLDILMERADSEDLETLAAAPQIAKILRVLRVTRVLRLAGKNEGLQALMQTITMSVTSLANVFLLLILVLFIFSILGVFFFQDLNSGEVIDGYKNFNNFGQSFLLLFAISTGEDWNKLMYDCVDTPPNCVPGETCGSSLAPAYYIIFVMIVSNVMLNLFILVIIQQFELYYVSDDNPIVKFKQNLDLFMKTWIEFTAKRYRCVKIREKQLNDFFKKLPPPIGLPDDVSDAELKKTMLKMGIRCDDGYIYFNELLYRCMRRQYGNFKLNKRMQIVELKTQYKIYLITLRAKKMVKQMKNQELFFEKMIGNDKAVNPFVQKMYYRISFNTWLNLMRKYERREIHESEMQEAKDRALALGMPFIEQQLQEEPTQFQYVTIEVEEIAVFTSEEEEESTEKDVDDSKTYGNKTSSYGRGRTIEQSRSSNQDRYERARKTKTLGLRNRDRSAGPQVSKSHVKSGQVIQFSSNLESQSALKKRSAKELDPRTVAQAQSKLSSAPGDNAGQRSSNEKLARVSD